MQVAAFWSRRGRGALSLIATGLMLGVGGCSSGLSRFDYPAFQLTGSESTGSTAPRATNLAYAADPATTASLPVPEESVYAPGTADTYSPPADSAAPYGRSGVARNDLPPPPAARPYTPRVTPASYSPAPRTSVMQPRKIAFNGGAPMRPEPAVVRTAAPDPSARTVKVAKGDSLSAIAKRNGVSIEALKAANNLSDVRIEVGQTLIIPEPGAPVETKAEAETETEAKASPPKTYKVQKGDTPHVIAAKLKVDEKALIARNKLRAEGLQIGQVLIVPGGADAPVAESDDKPDSASPDVHVVHTTTVPAPGAADPSHPSAPAPGAADASHASAPAPSEPSAVPDHAQSAAAASPEVTGPAPKSEPAPSSQVASVDQLPTPDPMSGNSFRWPVQGRIISVFGTKPDGGHNDGIDVAVPQGTSVKAAENGVVAYAGNELKGYGNLVLVRHANNWVSAYAHNEEILVKRGDKVRRGQIIAKAGNTGTVSQPQVHFELRKGSRPVDPTKYMSQTQANAD
jgi:murein DD-endopeptidase MepM/ murein hydrolase activator NlpD